MAPHSRTLAWKIPGMEEPGRLWSMGWLGVRHDWATSLSPFTFTHWRRKWQPTPVFLPGESQGRGSLVGCHLWGRTESDTTEATQQQQHRFNTDFWNLVVMFLHFLSVLISQQCKKKKKNTWKKGQPLFLSFPPVSNLLKSRCYDVMITKLNTFRG